MADTMTGGAFAPPHAAHPAVPSQRSELNSPRVAASLFSAVLVCALVVVAVETSRVSGLIATLWGAGGVAVVGWLSGPRSRGFDAAYAGIVLVAITAGNILVGNTPAHVALFSLCNLIEIAGAVWLIRTITPAVDLGSLKGLTRFLLAAPAVAPLPAALICAAALHLDGSNDFRSTFISWWFGHALGLAAIAPFGLSFDRDTLARWRKPRRAAEGAAILAAVAWVTWTAFFEPGRPVGFLATPLLLLAAVRLRMLGAAAAVLIITALAIYGAMYGHGQMSMIPGGLTAADRVRLVQLYVIFACVPVLPVAALLNERDRLADAARAGQAKAEAASAGKSRLLANVSHEIKSPVAGIIGIGELWSTGKLGPVTAMQEEMAEVLVRTARQVEALAYDLLDVARAESGNVAVNLRAVDVDGLVEDVRRTVAVKPEAAGLKWRVERAGDRFVARADSVRLSQVATNLATNAIKYGASGGIVIFRLSRPTPDRVRLEVIDKGPGIPPARQAELFEPFNRLGMEKTTIEGHGIGLALAKRLAELQGGAIGFASAPGEGARFWIDLPAEG